jgi:hypothetical protein
LFSLFSCLVSFCSYQFGSLFAKNVRVYKVWSSKANLSSPRISNLDLLMVLGALLLVDLAANIAWTASSGFPTRYVTVDEHRPVRATTRS